MSNSTYIYKKVKGLRDGIDNGQLKIDNFTVPIGTNASSNHQRITVMTKKRKKADRKASVRGRVLGQIQSVGQRVAGQVQSIGQRLTLPRHPQLAPEEEPTLVPRIPEVQQS